MAIKYVLTERANLQKPSDPKKWYASAKSTGETTLKELGKEITQRSTVNHADTLAVLEGLTQLLVEHLNKGEIVRFGDFGSFQVSIGSEGAETKKAFTSSMIRTPKVLFRPGTDIKTMLKALTYEKD